MASKLYNWLVHRVLRRSYGLFVRVDDGSGPSAVLLHGIASSGDTWQYVLQRLRGVTMRLLVVDLLGFGGSPKPKDAWVQYTVTDHARAVIKTLNKRHLRKHSTFVGHSMGCFVAIEVATLRPDLVGNLILYEPPFYTGLPNANKYRLRLAAYFAIYRRIIRRKPGQGRFKLAQGVLNKLYGFEINDETWVPFQRTMKNTILQQTALDDLKKLKIPVQIVYGKYDQVVINDKKKVFVGADAPNITALEIPELHAISPRASNVLAGLISKAASL
jgi:pimeloyl-ACP methyl ester carboxylesterase